MIRSSTSHASSPICKTTNSTFSYFHLKIILIITITIIICITIILSLWLLLIIYYSWDLVSSFFDFLWHICCEFIEANEIIFLFFENMEKVKEMCCYQTKFRFQHINPKKKLNYNFVFPVVLEVASSIITSALNCDSDLVKCIWSG